MIKLTEEEKAQIIDKALSSNGKVTINDRTLILDALPQGILPEYDRDINMISLNVFNDEYLYLISRAEEQWLNEIYSEIDDTMTDEELLKMAEYYEMS